jgi:hypothetical protein
VACLRTCLTLAGGYMAETACRVHPGFTPADDPFYGIAGTVEVAIDPGTSIRGAGHVFNQGGPAEISRIPVPHSPGNLSRINAWKAA